MDIFNWWVDHRLHALCGWEHGSKEIIFPRCRFHADRDGAFISNDYTSTHLVGVGHPNITFSTRASSANQHVAIRAVRHY